jgi:uncharacterized protein involved in cysteine biosynthesis
MGSEEVVGASVADAADFVMPHEHRLARPGRLRRFAAGAWHVPGGAWFLLRRPHLWGLAAIPSALGLAAIVGGLILGIYGVRGVDAAVGAHRLNLPDLLGLFSVLALWSGTLLSGVLAALALVLFLCAPLLERLGARAEASYEAGGATPPVAIGRAFRHALYLIPAVPIGFLLSLIPFVGPLLAALAMALVLAFQLTAPALARRGRDTRAIWRWQGAWRAETIGFGVAAVLLLPLISPVVAAALATGAARLVHEIESQPGAPAA